MNSSTESLLTDKWQKVSNVAVNDIAYFPCTGMQAFSPYQSLFTSHNNSTPSLIVEAAHTLYLQSPDSSQEHQIAIEALLAQVHWSNTTVAQALEAALALCYASASRSKEHKQGIEALIELSQRPDLSFEDALIIDDDRMIQDGSRVLVRQQLAAKKQMWETIAQISHLTSEQRVQVLQALEDYESWLSSV